jgi:hypothetical protein
MGQAALPASVIHSVECASNALLKFGFLATEATFSLAVSSTHGGSTVPSFVFLGRLTMCDSVRELAFADYFAMTFPPFTQSLWLLRAPFAPAELITPGAFAPPPAIQSLPASFAPFAVGLFWVLVKNKTLRQIGAKQERK